MDKDQFYENLNQLENLSFLDKFTVVDNGNYVLSQCATKIYHKNYNGKVRVLWLFCCFQNNEISLNWYPELSYPEELSREEVFELLNSQQQQEMLFALDLF